MGGKLNAANLNFEIFILKLEIIGLFASGTTSCGVLFRDHVGLV